jgi:hypothetical protein
MGTQRLQMKGVLPWLVCGAALAAPVSPVQNTIFPVHFFTLLVPIAQQPGQAVVLGRLSLCISLYTTV